MKSVYSLHRSYASFNFRRPHPMHISCSFADWGVITRAPRFERNTHAVLYVLSTHDFCFTSYLQSFRWRRHLHLCFVSTLHENAVGALVGFAVRSMQFLSLHRHFFLNLSDRHFLKVSAMLQEKTVGDLVGRRVGNGVGTRSAQVEPANTHASLYFVHCLFVFCAEQLKSVHFRFFQRQPFPFVGQDALLACLPQSRVLVTASVIFFAKVTEL